MTSQVVAASGEGVAAIAAIRGQLALRGDGFDASVADRRAALIAFADSQPQTADVAFIEERLGERRAVRVAPPDAAGTALYLHGGAYVIGSPDTHKGLAARYALASGLEMYVLDYRLAPEAPYPAGLEDAVAAACALADEDEDWALVGDSAGGGLALALLVALRDRGLPLPRVAALSSPWIDLSLSGASVDANAGMDVMLSRRGLEQDAQRYRGSISASDGRVSPLFADLAGLPPLFVQVGGAEILLDDSIRLYTRLTAAGGTCRLEIWEGMTHAWSAFGAMLPESGAAIEALGGFLRR